jgi:hypothetical protein
MRVMNRSLLTHLGFKPKANRQKPLKRVETLTQPVLQSVLTDLSYQPWVKTHGGLAG